jgi:hypothetical protein
MKFEVELISEGRFLIIDESGNPNITTGDQLAAAFMLLVSASTPAKTKRPYPKGTRKRKAKAEPAEAQG